ncbi:PREDICTED: uncharacterized protein LOC109335549 [Lupinus angustifolius]|uniref:uncharacterized protein LOC109335549 n=1 Tax=Lupinus angustifolius TaxID=3871 RepID=UPI00092F562C|nr:PREDICTED: uncharacterized protein LOC109335549 [Lupinus angustifolius]
MSHQTNSFPANLPILDGKNWSRWNIQMKAIMGFQELEEIVEEGYPEIDEASTEQQRIAYKENRKRDCKAMCLIHQCVDEAHFEKIAAARSSHEAWQILQKSNKGAEQLKKVRLQTMRRQYELMEMEMSERIAQFFNRIISLTNQMKACGEVIKDQTIIEKVMRTLTPNFDHIVVAIEESKNLAELKIEELQGSLEAHEQRLIERSTEKSTSQALQAQITRRGGGSYRGGIRNRGRGRDYRWKSSNQQDQEKSDQDHSLNTIKKNGVNNWRGGKKRLDRKRIKCFNCNKIGHLSYECQSSPGQSDSHGRHQNEAHMAKEERIDKEDETPVLLMMTTNQEISSGETWYIDSDFAPLACIKIYKPIII